MYTNPPISTTYQPTQSDQRQMILTAERKIGRLVDSLEPISLQEMDSVALLNRTDTKYMLSIQQLASVLRNLRYAYRVLTIKTIRIHLYSTLYFDTPNFELYHDHVTGRAEVFKVRSREYTDTHIAYLEVKHKDQKKRTDKRRLPLDYQSDALNGDLESFVNGLLPESNQDLEPKLWNTFRRITLVSKAAVERVTIDLDLQFYNEEKLANLDGIAIVEIKRAQLSSPSEFVVEMRRHGIRSMGFSKYCYGVACLYNQVKKNVMKEKFLYIEKILRLG